MAEVILEEVSKRFGDGTLAVDNVSLTIDDEEFFVFVGPSGCGKTTLLRMVAGLETVTSGSVRIGGTVVNNLEPGERDIAMVFQDYALYPHLTAYENLAFALKRRKLSRDEIESRVRSTAQMLGLSDLLGKKPGQLSGGQRQRIALGRAIVRNPQAFLMDEPLSNLDAKLRAQMRTELLKLHQGLPTTTVYVTHDQVEAMTMGHRVAVLRDGRIHQVDTPQRLYQSPRNVFVAGFIGSPAMNLCLGDVVSRDGKLIVSFGRYSVPVTSERRSGLEVYAGKPVFVGVRPEAFEDAALLGSGSQDLPQIQAHVDIVEHLGAETLVTFRTGAPPLRGEEARAADVQETALVEQEKAEAAFVARLDPRTSARTGTFLNLAVDPARIHFFDPATGNAIASLGGE